MTFESNRPPLKSVISLFQRVPLVTAYLPRLWHSQKRLASKNTGSSMLVPWHGRENGRFTKENLRRLLFGSACDTLLEKKRVSSKAHLSKIHLRIEQVFRASALCDIHLIWSHCIFLTTPQLLVWNLREEFLQNQMGRFNFCSRTSGRNKFWEALFIFSSFDVF